MGKTMIDVERTVAELVLQRPGRARVFERLEIDYCCGGKVPLADACAARGLDAQTVAVLLEAVESAVPTPEAGWTRASLVELCDHIVESHHAYLRDELPRLALLVDKVARAHGASDPALRDVSETFHALAAELDGHLEDEEVALFPLIERLEAGGTVDQAELRAALAALEREHGEVGAALSRLRALTAGYVAPGGACNSWRAMLDGLKALERDLHEHVHEENNILFPRVAELARAGRSRRTPC